MLPSKSAFAAAALLVLVAALPYGVQAKAVLSGTTINIWSEGGSHVQTCASLLSDVPTKVKACEATYTKYTICISVDASINITRGGATNWTNFSVNGCEIRMNMTADGSNIIYSWGNFTVINSNITTNNSAMHSAILIKANSNFSMTSSFVSEMGWSDTADQRGLEINSPVLMFMNNTMTNNENSITLYSGANGTNISYSNISRSVGYGIHLYYSGNNTIQNNNVSDNTGSDYGIHLYYSHNNSVRNNKATSDWAGIFMDHGSFNILDSNNVDKSDFYGVYLVSSFNNTLTNINASFNPLNGIHFYSSSNNTLTNINASYNTDGIHLWSNSDNNILTNITANSNTNYGINTWSYSDNNILTNIIANYNVYSGVFLYSNADNNTLTNITASSNTLLGIYLHTSSNNILTNITANSNIRYGIYISNNANNNIFSNLNIWQCSPTTTSYACIFSGTSQNNTLRQGVVNLTGKYLIDMGDSTTLFQDIRFINVTNIAGGINLATNSYVTFLNCSFTGVTEAVSGNSQLIRQWYLDARVIKQADGSGIGGANLTVRNASQSLINYSYTSSMGWVQRLSLTEYINNSGSVSQWQPYNISAFKAGYIANSSNGPQNTIPLTSNTIATLALTASDATPPQRSDERINGQNKGYTFLTGTTTVTIILTTDENAFCRNSTTAGTDYNSMTPMSTTGATSHLSTYGGLQNGNTYHYYVKCQDMAVPPNTNIDDDDIYFSVAAAQPPSGGGSTPGFETGLFAVVAASLLIFLLTKSPT